MPPGEDGQVLLRNQMQLLLNSGTKARSSPLPALSGFEFPFPLPLAIRETSGASGAPTRCARRGRMTWFGPEHAPRADSANPALVARGAHPPGIEPPA